MGRPTSPSPVPLPSVLVTLLLLAGCAPGMRFPGPLRPLARPPIEAVASAVRNDEPESALATFELSRAARAGKTDPFGTAMADAAEYYLLNEPKGFRSDCSGFVGAVTARAGAALEGSTASLWELADGLGATHTRKRPRVGDLAFFDGTYDRDKNGKQDDPLTHVAVVIGVADDGTVTMAHGGTSIGRTTLRMNLEHPDRAQSDEGVVWNDPLRAARRADPAKTKYLAGELFRGFATLRLHGSAWAAAAPDALADDGS